MKRYEVEELEALKRVLDNGTLSGFFRNMHGGPEIQAFEADLNVYLGPETKTLTCSNGTSALHLALMALNMPPDAKVAVPALTFSATATAVLQAGGIPVCIDVDPTTWGMGAADLAEYAEGGELFAAIPVHLLGVPCQIGKIMEMGKRYNFFVIEDNAQALGATVDGRKTGSFGQLSTLSFQDTKVMTTLGEGGAVAVNYNWASAEACYNAILSLRNHGQQYLDDEGHFAEYTCWNYRMTEAQAAFGAVQLKRLDRWNLLQRLNRLIFKDVVDGMGFAFQECLLGDRGTHYIYGAYHYDVELRNKWLKRLGEWTWCGPHPGSTISAGYTKTIFDLPLLRKYRRPTPIADDLVKKFIWFDIGRWLTLDEFLNRAEQIARIMREVT